MPVYNTHAIANLPATPSRPIAQVVIKIINNGTDTEVSYNLGSELTTTKHIIAQEIVTVSSSQVVTRSYNVPFDFFQFEFIASSDQVEAAVFAVSPSGVYTNIPLHVVPLRRITSEFRDNIPASLADFAAISFRRTSNFVLPAQRTAAIYPEGLDILPTRPIRYKIILGGTVNGTFVSFPTPTTNIPASQTALQVNFTCTTITGGTVLFQGGGSGLSGTYFTTSVNLIQEQLRTSLPGNTPVTLVISSASEGASISAVFRMLEEW